MSIDTVAVTGGNGRLGKHILKEFRAHDYGTANLARGSRREDVSDQYITTDLTEPGDVYGSLGKTDADAIVHMGTIASPHSHPGHVTFENNVMSSYHVLEAATDLGVDIVCLPSSINAMGASFQKRPIEVDYVPVNEDHRLTPRDPYATAKQAIEVMADGFGRRADGPETIGSLRYPWVAYPSEIRSSFSLEDRRLESDIPDVPGGRQELFAYVLIDDAATAARKMVEADFDGHETFWIAADDTTMATHTDELVAEMYPETDRRRELPGTESLVDTTKARDVLGWRPEQSWREI
jgi:nucleoside-diphosphate-sugar epimerase